MQHSWATATGPLRAAFEDVIQNRQRRRELHGYQPTAESRAMAERAAAAKLTGYVGEPTNDACTFADLLLLAAEDHFDSICALVERQRGVLYSDKVLARAGIEACARAAWLLDPGIGAESRAARGLTQRFANIKANIDLLKALDTGEQLLKDQRAHRDQLIAACQRAGLTVIRKDGSAFVVQEVPTERSVMRHLLSAAGDTDLGSFVQSWLSRFVHSDTAGLMELFADELPDDVEAPVVVGMVTKGLAINSEWVNRLVALCATAYISGAGRYMRHLGWEDEEWNKLSLNLRGFIRAACGVP